MVKLTLQERFLLLWVFKQKRLQHEEGKYDALDEKVLKGIFERLFFGTYMCQDLEVEKGGSSPVHSVSCLSFHGNKIFAGGDGESIQVWSADTHKLLATLEAATEEDKWNSVKCLAVYDKKLFAGVTPRTEVCDMDGETYNIPMDTIRVWDADTHEELASMKGVDAAEGYGGVTCLTFYGNKIFSSSNTGSVYPIDVWNANTHEHLTTLGLDDDREDRDDVRSHWGEVKCLALYENKIFSGGDSYNQVNRDFDGRIHVWDADTHDHLASLGGEFLGDVKCLALYDNKLFCATGSCRYEDENDCGVIEVWNADTHEHLATLEAHMDCCCPEVTCLTFYGNKLFSGNTDRTIRVWDADTHEHLATLEGHTGAVLRLTLCGNELFSAGSLRDEYSMHVWNADTLQHVASLKRCTYGFVECVALYNNKLFCGTDCGTIAVWKKEED
jgi:WD40 repeat protein